MKKEFAFTLAEVLITLGIIGVISAITLPVLLSNLENKQNIIHWRKMYSVISQAYMQTIEEGYSPCPLNSYSRSCDEILAWPRRSDIDITFIEKMVEKFNVSEVCTSPECHHNSQVWAPDYYRKYKTLAGETMYSYNFTQYRIRLASGELIMFGSSHGGPWITIDVNGYGQGKDTLGKDVFIIRVFDKYLRPMGAEGTFNKKANGEKCECSKNKGTPTAVYIDNIFSEAVSGACCSAYYLLNDK